MAPCAVQSLVRRHRPLTPRLLDVLSGLTAPISAAERAAWEVEGYDVMPDVNHDLTDDVLLQKLCLRLRAGEFSLLFPAPLCRTFSSFTRLSPTPQTLWPGRWEVAEAAR